MIVGRNIPVAAVIPLTFSLFGIGEFQKIMFIFIACVAFVVMDTATADRRREQPLHRHGLHPGRQPLADHPQGAGPAGHAQHLQLAAAAVRPGLRLHHAGRGDPDGRASGGLGKHHQLRPKPRRHRDLHPPGADDHPWWPWRSTALLFWVQRQLFPYQYGGDGLLHRGLRAVMRGWESLWSLVIKPVDVVRPAFEVAAAAACRGSAAKAEAEDATPELPPPHDPPPPGEQP